MNSSCEQVFQAFKALLSKWEGAYAYSVHSYVALKGLEGGQLLFGRVLLEPTREGINETPFWFETEHIIAGRFVRVITPESIAGLIEKAKSGQMDTERGIVSLVRGGSGDSDSMVSGSLASPKPPAGGEPEERGNEENETESRSHV